MKKMEFNFPSIYYTPKEYRERNNSKDSEIVENGLSKYAYADVIKYGNAPTTADTDVYKLNAELSKSSDKRMIVINGGLTATCGKRKSIFTIIGFSSIKTKWGNAITLLGWTVGALITFCTLTKLDILPKVVSEKIRFLQNYKVTNWIFPTRKYR